MVIRFIISGESPQVGIFNEGEERDIADDIAKVFIKRKIAVEVKHFKKEKEVKEHG